MRTRLATLILLVILSLPLTARGQSIPLPKIDSINIYGQIGDFEGNDAIDAKTYGPFGTYGWGFETAFNLITADTHVVELAVGYDQLYQHAKFKDGFILDGEIRNLPNVSLYVSFKNDLYVGVATGIVSLANATINDGTTRVAIAGDTFDLAAKIGYAIPLQPETSIAERRVNGFVEADYHVRYFGGLNYGSEAPADLPSRVYLGGFTVLAGIQVSIDGGKAKAEEKAKLDAKNKLDAKAKSGDKAKSDEKAKSDDKPKLDAK